MLKEFKRGQIWIANLSGGVGSEQRLISRPVIVVQNNMGNKFSPTITIVPMTSSTSKKWLPTHVTLHKTTCLKSLSIALIEQLTTISKERLTDYIGEVNYFEMLEIENSLMIQLGMVLNKNKIVYA